MASLMINALTLLTLEQGQIQGKLSQDYNGNAFYSFQGIPYAAPPINELRFKEPQPPLSWQGVRDGTKEGSICYSHHMINRTIMGSEDCLFLNVYTRELQENYSEPKYLRPVMVWVHGGAFVSGSGNTDVYGPDFLMTKDIVLVTMNFRTGILGFLSLNDTNLNVPGNAGIKDIVMALKWIQKNIKKFAGDPNSITFFGESSGASTISWLMLSPNAKGLFHKVIIQSGSTLGLYSRGIKFATKIADKLQIDHKDEEKLLNTLKNLTLKEILDIQDSLGDSFYPSEQRVFGATVENVYSNTSILTEEPRRVLEAGNYTKIPVIIGYLNGEGILFDITGRRNNKSRIINDYELWVPNYLNLRKGSDLSLQISKDIKEFYFGTKTPSEETLSQDDNLRTDTYFLYGIYKSTINFISDPKENVYVYRLSLETLLNFYKIRANTTRPGACHADDLGYLFKWDTTPQLASNSVEEKSIEIITKLWTNFARTGNPNSNDECINKFTWEPVAKDLKVLNINRKIIMEPIPEKSRMEFWDKIEQKVFSENSK